MDAVAATEQSQATTPQQASLIALRIEAQSQQAIADLLARQAAEQAQAVPAAANPEGLGGSVDTYA
ncbi:MAG TPA: hypothetical protein PLL19_08810 [Thiobacillaceae bacterium]|nr:hypothetical protein [Thiobacillaceae bacterium]HNA82003.1 hypothetical protein [Thiobacillaceae bacterium]HNF89417.1 hypothetical protein [Thiobacillaceae bacterium]HNH89300.1 hypothetical protein [Thiobacillaceae bacterium]HNI08381.1 hypothetical protein [Thiobacillaceae bacterium]